MSGSADIVVAGAGALGATVSLALARAGRRVIQCDPASLDARTSAIAAGMLAPAFETLFDETTEGRYDLLRAARDRWPELADSIGLPLDRSGALAVGSAQQTAEWTAKLDAVGAQAKAVDVAGASTMAPGLRDGFSGTFSPDDWRLDPIDALRRLQAEAQAVGAATRSATVRTWENGQVGLDDGDTVAAGLLVIATGAGRSLASIAPELRALAPIKGHILRARANVAQGRRVVRGDDVYLCPATDGWILGASMEAGRDDLIVDPRIVADLEARATRVFPGVSELDWRPSVGVRAETPDGLPLVGRAMTSNVVLAVGARRNGWLLAPLVAAIVADIVEGRAAGPEAQLFDPARLKISRRG